jgi:hypothetical protein
MRIGAAKESKNLLKRRQVRTLRIGSKGYATFWPVMWGNRGSKHRELSGFPSFQFIWRIIPIPGTHPRRAPCHRVPRHQDSWARRLIGPHVGQPERSMNPPGDNCRAIGESFKRSGGCPEHSLDLGSSAPNAVRNTPRSRCNSPLRHRPSNLSAKFLPSLSPQTAVRGENRLAL